MKALSILLPVLALATSQLRAESPTPSGAFHREASPAASKISSDLFWVADTCKMDAFLAKVQMNNLRAGAYSGEILPDMRAAWGDYASEAKVLATQGQESAAAAKLAQMLKLAAVYRSFGGLQNVVQGEEIRYLAGRTAANLGAAVTALIRSPYLEKDAADCLVLLAEKASDEKSQVTPFFWRQLERRAVDTHYRLSARGSVALASKP